MRAVIVCAAIVCVAQGAKLTMVRENRVCMEPNTTKKRPVLQSINMFDGDGNDAEMMTEFRTMYMHSPDALEGPLSPMNCTPPTFQAGDGGPWLPVLTTPVVVLANKKIKCAPFVMPGLLRPCLCCAASIDSVGSGWFVMYTSAQDTSSKTCLGLGANDTWYPLQGNGVPLGLPVVTNESSQSPTTSPFTNGTTSSPSQAPTGLNNTSPSPSQAPTGLNSTSPSPSQAPTGLNNTTISPSQTPSVAPVAFPPSAAPTSVPSFDVTLSPMESRSGDDDDDDDEYSDSSHYHSSSGYSSSYSVQG